MDFQKPYLETILGFMGITDVRTLLVEGTAIGGDDVLADAKAAAADAGASF